MVLPSVASAVPILERILSITSNARVHLKHNHSVYVVCYRVSPELWDELNPVKILNGLGRLDYEEFLLVIVHEDGLTVKKLWIANSLSASEGNEDLADRLATQIRDNYLGAEYSEYAQLIPIKSVNSEPIKVSEAGQII